MLLSNGGYCRAYINGELEDGEFALLSCSRGEDEFPVSQSSDVLAGDMAG